MKSLTARARLTSTLVLLVTLATMVATAPPASAAELVVTDPSGDTQVAGLDITGATLVNADYRLSTAVHFRSIGAGTVVVGLKARDRSLLRLVSLRRADGTSRSFLVDRSGDPIACRSLTVTWRDDPATVTFGIGSRCLWEGNYGAARAWYLTEAARTGNDVDYAPETAGGTIGFSRWVARG